jgi:hypothetical protein
MKVLWVVNGPTNEFILKNYIKSQYSISWLSGYMDINSSADVKLSIAFPYLEKIQQQELDAIDYYSFFQPKMLFTKYPKNKVTNKTIQDINEIIAKVKPDILHIFGTEYYHAYTFSRIFNKPSKTVIHIQGLTQILSLMYTTDIPLFYKIMPLPSTLYRGNIIQQKYEFQKRGLAEKRLLEFVSNISGRTHWDKDICSIINPTAEYHLLNENLRKFFLYQ